MQLICTLCIHIRMYVPVPSEYTGVAGRAVATLEISQNKDDMVIK